MKPPSLVTRRRRTAGLAVGEGEGDGVGEGEGDAGAPEAHAATSTASRATDDHSETRDDTRDLPGGFAASAAMPVDGGDPL
jgi:hypothetical protein